MNELKRWEFNDHLTVRRINSEIDGQVGNSLIGSSHAVRLILDLFHDGVKIHKLFAFGVQKLSVFIRRINQLQN